MINKEFELDRLRTTLRTRGLDTNIVDQIVDKARAEIDNAMSSRLSEAMAAAIAAGVEKRSAEFINDLQPAPNAFQLETESGNTDFSTPPYPMLSRLLKEAKPMADGSGVYKVIPVGSSKTQRPRISDNIFDTQKAIAAQRAEAAKRQYNKMAPAGSKTQFRTATSKQSSEQWVIPAKEKDFTIELSSINSELDQALQEVIISVIREYEEQF